MNAASQSLRSDLSRLLRRAARALEANALEQAGRLYDEALRRQPDNFDALHGLGLINCRRGRLDTAALLFRAAVRADDGRPEGFASLGLVLHLMGRLHEALASYEVGVRLAPDDADLLNRRGVALLDTGRPCEALADFERVLALDPDHLDALGNCGNALLKLNRPEQALAAYDRALKLAPANAQLLTNRAVALRRLDRPREALMSATRALAAQPDFAPARFVEALARLTLGDYAAGWRAYEARWRVGLLASQRRNFTAPLWLGDEPLDGKTILLHAEQGSGDTIQFARYAPIVAKRGAVVLLEVQTELARLLKSVPGVRAVVARGQGLPQFDFHCPLLSLPLRFGTEIATIPAAVPYIAAPAQDVAHWRELLPRRGLRIGLAWSGARAHDNDANRSLRLPRLAPLFDLPGVQFVGLQREVREEDRAFLQSCDNLFQIGDRFRDFADTAAAVSVLDLVISVDTAVAHLAGALGKPLHLLLPFAADFRWLRERRDSPWYPTARLHRQPRLGDWEGVIGAIAGEVMRHLGRTSVRVGQA